MKQVRIWFSIVLSCFSLVLFSQEIAILKYSGGGDWYANPTGLPNLISYCNNNINTTIKNKPAIIEASDSGIFQYPFLYMTGHGNVVFTEAEAANLRTYLLSGGFLHIDDNFGMEPYLKKELLKIFPDKKLEELGANHNIFKQEFQFPEGLPKIHEHNGKRPQALGYFHEDRLILLFTYECDLGDGWEDPAVHNNPPEIRKKALQMGANIVSYVFKN